MLLDEMEIFYFVAEYKSFSKAAKRLNVSKSYISKKITKLEESLKVHLLSRSTRTLSLTKAGENFYQYCANIVRESNEAFSMMSELKGKASGVLKISIPTTSGLHLISHIFPKFLEKYPDIILYVELDNRLVDVIEEGYDLVLRAGTSLKSSNLIAQRIFTVKSIVCATDNYFQKYGVPQVPSDLENHNCAYSSYYKQANNIVFKKDGMEETVHVRGNLICNHLDLVKQMVLNDVSIAVLPLFMVKDEVESGKLIPCLSDYQLNQNTLYAIYPNKKYIPPKIKYFIEELKKYLDEF